MKTSSFFGDFRTMHTVRLNTYGRRAFSVAGPTVWNSLPNFIRDPTISLDCFRRLLKTYLFARYYAFSALEVLTTTALYKFTYLLTYFTYLHCQRNVIVAIIIWFSCYCNGYEDEVEYADLHGAKYFVVVIIISMYQLEIRKLFWCATLRREASTSAVSGLHSGSGLMPSFRRRQCVMSKFTLTLTSACILTSATHYPTISSCVCFTDSGYRPLFCRNWFL